MENTAPSAVNDVKTVNAGFNGESTYWFGLDFYKLITNDSDAEGDAISITSVDGQALIDGTVTVTGSNGGTFTVLADGTVYLDASTGFETLAVGETLDTAVTYTVTDANGASSTATYTVTINGMNDAVKANVDAVSVAENAPLALNILDNDTAFDGDKAVSAVDGDALNLGVAVAGDNGGAFTINADGSTTFVQGTDFDYLAEGQTVVSSVAYTIAGYNGENSTSTVAVTVTGINDAPNAVNDVKTVNAGFNGESTYWFGLDFYKLITNDSDAEGDAISITAVDGQALVDGTVTVTGSNGGTFTVSADGTVYLDASTGFETLAVGETLDTAVTYTVTDANGASTTATYTVTINGMNDAVKANVDAVSVAENAPLALNVLDNDTAFDGDKSVSAVDGDALNIGAAVAGDNGGAFTINADGSTTFVQGTDFDYLAEGQTVVSSVAYTIAGYNGENSTSTVAVTVTGINDAPNAVNDVKTVNAGFNGESTYWFGLDFYKLITNDSDAEGDAISITSVDGQALVDGTVTVTGSNGGTFTVSADGTVYLDASTGFETLAVGETLDTEVTYTVTDANGASTTATYTVTINGMNDAVKANVDAVSVAENAPLALNVLDNDTAFDGDKSVSAVDGDALNIGAAVAGDNGGAFTINADGSTTFVQGTDFDYLAEGQTVVSSVAYTIAGYNGENSTSTVAVTVTGINDAPNAVNDVKTVNAGFNGESTYWFGLDFYKLITNDSDAEGDAISITSVDGQALVDGTVTVTGSNGGTFTVSADGTVNLDVSTGFETLAVGETLDTAITYTVSDANGASTTATYTVTINGMNDAVVANVDEYSTTEDEAITGNVLENEDSTAYIIDVDGLFENIGQAIFGDNGGVFVIDEDGSFSFEPQDDFAHLTIGEYEVTTINITIGGNFTPWSFAVSITIYGNFDTNQDEVTMGNILTNDFSFDGDKTVTKINDLDTNVGQEVVGDNGGTFLIEADGTSTFDPNDEFNYLAEGETTTTSIGYTIEGYNGEYSTSTVTVTVTGINDAPNAVNDVKTVNAGFNGESTYWFGLDFYKLITNDSDAEGDAISITSVDGQALVDGTVTVTGSNGGTFTVLADGTVYLDASTGFETLAVGETLDTAVTYTVTDANGASTTATYTVTVNGMNDAVKANVDAASVAENAPLALNVLDNDTAFDGNKVVSAVDGDALNLGAAVGGDNGGAFTINADGSTTFVQGTDFDYLAEGQTVVSSVAYTIAGYNGENSTSTVAVTVTGINDAPNAVDDIKTVNAGFNGESTYWFGLDFYKLITNDSDAEGDAISITSVDGQALVDGTVTVTGSNGGTFTVLADGTVNLDASTGFETLAVGETLDTAVTYTVSDANGASTTATYTVTVNGMNDAVKANVDAASVAENAPLALNVLDNDTAFDGNKVVSAVDGDALNLGAAVGGDNGGAFTINADGSTTFEQGTDFDYLAEGQTVVTSVAYTTEGYNGENSSSTVAITVTGINDAPNAVNDIKTVNAGFNGESTYWFGTNFNKLITNDSDAEGDAISISAVDGQALVDGSVTVTGSNGGVFTISADGTVHLDASTDFETVPEGQAVETSIDYTVDDGNGGTDVATYTVTVQGDYMGS